VKQQCVFKLFIAINDNLEVGFYIKQSEWGREQDSGETERECVRDSVLLKVKDNIGHKMDSWRKHLVMDMCN
jgi:hypothetical protein